MNEEIRSERYRHQAPSKLKREQEPGDNNALGLFTVVCAAEMCEKRYGFESIKKTSEPLTGPRTNPMQPKSIAFQESG